MPLSLFSKSFFILMISGVFLGCSSQIFEGVNSPLTPSAPTAVSTDEIVNANPTEVIPEPTPDIENQAFPEVVPGLPALTLWHGLTGPQRLTLYEIVAAYQVQHPVRVALRYAPHDDLYASYVTAVQELEGAAILLGPGKWGPKLYDEGVIMAVSGYTSSGLLSNINPPALKAVEYQNALIGLPYAIRGVVLVRNAAIIPSASQTFDHLVVAAQDATQGKIIGAYLDRGVLVAIPQMKACGASLMYANGSPAFNTDAGLCWLNLLKSFDKAGLTAFNNSADFQQFKAGRVGIILDGTWNLEELSQSLGEDLVIDPWPILGSRQLSGYVWQENIYLSSNLDSQTELAAWQFLEFFLSPVAQSILADSGLIPARLNLEVADPLISQAMIALESGTPYPLHPEMKVFWEPLSQALESVFRNNAEPRAALQQAYDEIYVRVRRIQEEKNESGN